MYIYDLLKGRKYRENKKRYQGPCTVKSIYSNLENKFPGSFIFKGTTNGDNVDTNNFNKKTDYDLNYKGQVDVNLIKKHKGFGKWVVINTETDQCIHDGFLTKEEARQLCNE